MTTAPLLSKATALYQEAENAGLAAIKDTEDNGYGCGSSFVTIKGNTAFYRELKKLGKTSRDAYYGFILDTNDDAHTSGTLASEAYNRAFAHHLSENGVHAFNHTYLT